jgi:hypothetical protein
VSESLIVISREQVLRLIRGEYIEMPGLRLTTAQAQRLWGLDAQTCASVLEALREEAFLSLRDDGTYCRISDGHQARLPTPSLRSAR